MSMVVTSYDHEEEENHNCLIRYCCCNIYNPRNDIALCCGFLSVITIIIAVTAGVCANAWFIYVNTIANPRMVNITSNWNDTFNAGSVTDAYRFDLPLNWLSRPELVSNEGSYMFTFVFSMQ